MAERDLDKTKDKSKGKDKNVVLTTRDLVLLFVFFIVVLMIVFVVGLMVGKNFAEKPLAENQPPPTETKTPTTTADSSNIIFQESNLPPAKSSPVVETKLLSETTKPVETTPPVIVERTQTRTSGSKGKPTVGPSAASSKPVPEKEKPKEKPAQIAAKTGSPKPVERPATKPEPTAKTSSIPSKPAETPPIRETFFIVQTLATLNLEEARKMVATLKQKGYADAFIKMPDADSKDKRYKVRAGKFRDKAHADTLLAKLKKDGFETFLARVSE